MSTDVNTVVARSTFVTVTAWIFIVLSAFATLTSVMQNVMVTLMFSSDEIVQAVNLDPKAPAGMAFVFGHLRLILILFLGLCVATLASSVGLLQRREWARRLFIAMLVVGILWMVAGFAMQYFFMSSINATAGTSAATNAAIDAQFDLMMKLMAIVSALISLIFVALFGWIIKRLMSSEIRREFPA